MARACGTSLSLSDVVVCLCACLNIGFFSAFTVSLNLFFNDWISTFNMGRGSIASVQAVCVGIICGGGLIGGILERKFGERMSLLVGSFLSSAGFFLGGFAASLGVLIVCVGVISGSGYCLIVLTTFSTALRRFSQRAGFMSSAMSFTSGLCLLVPPFLFRYLTEIYSWRGCLILSSSITLHTTIFSLLLTSPLLRTTKPPENIASPLPPDSDLLELSGSSVSPQIVLCLDPADETILGHLAVKESTFFVDDDAIGNIPCDLLSSKASDKQQFTSNVESQVKPEFRNSDEASPWHTQGDKVTCNTHKEAGSSQNLSGTPFSSEESTSFETRKFLIDDNCYLRNKIHTMSDNDENTVEMARPRLLKTKHNDDEIGKFLTEDTGNSKGKIKIASETEENQILEMTGTRLGKYETSPGEKGKFLKENTCHLQDETETENDQFLVENAHHFQNVTEISFDTGKTQSKRTMPGLEKLGPDSFGMGKVLTENAHSLQGSAETMCDVKEDHSKKFRNRQRKAEPCSSENSKFLKDTLRDKTETSEGNSPTRAKLLKWAHEANFVTNPVYITLVLTAVLNFVIFCTFIFFVLDIAMIQGWSLDDGVMLSFVIMVSNLVVRASLVIVNLHPRINSIIILALTGIVGSVGVSLIGQVGNYILLACVSCTMIVGYAGAVSMFPPSILQAVGRQQFTLALGLAFTIQGLMLAPFPGLTGFLVDFYQSYWVVSLVYGAISLLTNVFLLFVLRRCSSRSRHCL